MAILERLLGLAKVPVNAEIGNFVNYKTRESLSYGSASGISISAHYIFGHTQAAG
jgi:hypothetical protein